MLELRDLTAQEVTGVQIGNLGHKLWVCIDGTAVLRVKSPQIEVTDLRATHPSPNPASQADILQQMFDRRLAEALHDWPARDSEEFKESSETAMYRALEDAERHLDQLRQEANDAEEVAREEYGRPLQANYHYM